MKTWSIILATLVIFSAGAITGALVVQHSSKPAPVAPKAHAPPVPKPFSWAENFKDWKQKLETDLHITAEQSHQIDHILEESHQRFKILWKGVEPAVHEEMARVEKDILQVLTPEQRAKWDEYKRRFQAITGNRPPAQ